MPPKRLKQNVFTCLKEGCSESFESPWKRSRHHKKCEKPLVAKAYKSDGNGFICGKCSKHFSTSANVLKHIRNVHSAKTKKARQPI